ncbi:MAG: epoxyqueuosine reductase [Clostridia bacterium]|nr:epoxyqueuosine reductase [Clostridia bacterium]
MFADFDAYFVKNNRDGMKTVLLLSAVRYPESGQDTCGIDPYYFTSQNAYNNTKKLIENIKSKGYFAQKANDVYLKQLAAEMGIGSIGLNTICGTEEFGSFFEMEAICTDMPLEESTKMPAPVSCTNCMNCMNACPTGAITPDGFVRENCLRNHMLSGKPVPEHMREKMGQRLIGCSICRDVCPNNKGKKLMGAILPVDLTEVFSLEDMLDTEGKSVHQKRREEILGSNLVRRERLCAQAIIIAANAQRKDLIGHIKKLVGHKNPAIAQHALWAEAKLEREG